MQNKDYKFNPRGIVKWHAFAALISGETQKDSATDIELLDIELLDDKLDILNQRILDAYHNNLKVRITYIDNNSLIITDGLIHKIDLIKRIITVNDTIIQTNDIKDIIIL